MEVPPCAPTPEFWLAWTPRGHRHLKLSYNPSIHLWSQLSRCPLFKLQPPDAPRGSWGISRLNRYIIPVCFGSAPGSSTSAWNTSGRQQGGMIRCPKKTPPHSLSIQCEWAAGLVLANNLIPKDESHTTCDGNSFQPLVFSVSLPKLVADEDVDW